MILFSHPLGNANVRAVLGALEEDGVLEAFFTSIAVDVESFPISHLPSSWKSELRRRSYSVGPEKIHTVALREIARILSIRCGWHSLLRHESGWASVDQVWREVDRKAARWLECRGKAAGIRGVYAYEDGALEVFRSAKKEGVRCIYDLPIGYFEAAHRIFEEEKERMPLFADSLECLLDSEKKLDRKREEVRLADRIVAASDFVAQTLTDSGIEKDKIRVVQFGAPGTIPPAMPKENHRSEKLKVLLVGRLDQRKGIGYLLEAVRRMGDSRVELILMGSLSGNPRWMEEYRGLYRYEPPRPQPEVWKMMQACDCFVLPSLFEGQALVVLEAMRCSMPVIVTPNAGASRVVRDGVDGFVVPIRSSEVIAEKLSWMLDHPGEKREMGREAQRRVLQFTWSLYRSQIKEIVREGLSPC